MGGLAVASRGVAAAAEAPTVLRINAGGPTVTSGGLTWSADQYFTGGKAFVNSSVTNIAGTTDDVLYRTERSATSDLGGFSYAIPVPVQGTYTVRLHFAEIWFGAPGGGPAGAGKRVFSANLLQGAIELLDYDIFAEVGAVTAIVKTFAVEVLNGVLSIDFSAKTDQPKLSAIEVVFPNSSVPSEQSKVLRINAGGPAVTTGGVLWAEDQFYSGGKSFVNQAVYDPGTDRWAQIANMPTPKSHSEAGTFVSEGKIIMAGGQVDNFQPTSQVVAYDPLLNRWSILPALPAPRQGAVIQRVDKKIVIALGGIQTSEPQSNVWIGNLP